MPCNRRFQQHHPRAFCHPGAWHPGHHFPAAAVAEGLFAAMMEDAAAATHPAWNETKPRTTTSDNDDAHEVRMDVPGVKAERISIDEKNGEIEITAVRMNGQKEVAKVYQEVFYLNPFRYDIDQAKALLANGVLSLTIPKSQAGKVQTFAVESDSVPAELPLNVFQESLDLPGVPASSLQVKLIEDRIHLTGKRSLGETKRVLAQRSFEVPPSIDTLQARALLQDGVFTFLAPIHETEDDGQHLRTIFVQEGSMEVESAAASMADVKITDEDAGDNKPKADESMEEEEDVEVDGHVETVNEEAEAKDSDSWEEVRPSASA
jgi:HSP20 family molecular chaperone IbpA